MSEPSESQDYQRGFQDGYDKAREEMAREVSEFGQQALVGFIAKLLRPVPVRTGLGY